MPADLSPADLALIERLSAWAARFGPEVRCPVGVGPDPQDIRALLRLLSAARADGPGGGERFYDPRTAESVARVIYETITSFWDPPVAPVRFCTWEELSDDGASGGRDMYRAVAKAALARAEGPALSPVMVEGGLGKSGADIAPAASSGPVTAAEQAGVGAIPADWKPTAASINALPEPVRRHIHDIATLCDPAGIVLENAQLREQAKAVEAMFLAHKADDTALTTIATTLLRIADTLDGTAAGLCVTETIFGASRHDR